MENLTTKQNAEKPKKFSKTWEWFINPDRPKLVINDLKAVLR